MNQIDAKKRSESQAGAPQAQPPGPRPAGQHPPDQQNRERAGGRSPVSNALGPAALADERDKARMASEGGTEGQVGDTSGPGAGYDGEPGQVKDQGGVL
jgi:hypothetical protein